MVISNLLDKNVDPIEIVNLAIKNNIVDQDSGIDMDRILDISKNQYNFHYYTIGSNEMNSYIKNGNVVLAKVKFNENSNKTTFTCSHCGTQITNFEGN